MPLFQNATYAFRSGDHVEAWQAGLSPHFHYARDGNPTVRCLELKLADLEGAEAAVATATGMAAISATLLHLVPAGGHVVAAQELYAVTKAFLSQDLPRHGASVDLVDFGDPAAVEAAITPATRALFCETFSNPGVRVVDLPALAEVARRCGVAPGCRQHLPLAGAAAPDRARGGPGRPQRHQVPLRARQRAGRGGLRRSGIRSPPSPGCSPGSGHR